MSQLTLFTDSRFPCPQRLQLVILELGLEITDVHQVDIMNREQQVINKNTVFRRNQD
jgi:hypothetical protein